MKLEQDRSRQWNIEAMLASYVILASYIDRGLFVEIGYTGQGKGSLVRTIRTAGVYVDGNGLGTSLLASPASNVRPAVVNRNTVNVPDDRADILRSCFTA